MRQIPITFLSIIL